LTLREVRLLGLPVAIHRRASEHTDAINRELSLIAASDQSSVPARLQDLSERLTAQYSAMTAAQIDQLETAIRSETPTIDLVYELPESAADGAEEMAAMLDEVDGYCRKGDLLSLVTPPEALAYRRWFLGEFVRQIRDGAEPRPWRDHRAAGEATDEPPKDSGKGTEPAVIDVHGALDLDGASRLRPVLSEILDDGHDSLVLDLEDCDFVDSVGISLMLTSRSRCLELGGSLRVRNLQPFVRTTLLHAGLLDLLADRS
jgi:anti-anti-sigma factor